MGSTLKGKNLLLGNKFFPPRVDSNFEEKQKMKMAELLPLKMYPLTQRFDDDLISAGKAKEYKNSQKQRCIGIFDLYVLLHVHLSNACTNI